MSESIFHRLEGDWQDWFSRHVHHADAATAALTSHTASISTNQPPWQPKGAAVSLTDVIAAFKTDLEDGETKIRTVLDEHVPALVALAEKVSNDPLIQAAEAAALPPGAKQLVADFITKLAATFPPPAPVEAAPEPQAA